MEDCILSRKRHSSSSWKQHGESEGICVYLQCVQRDLLLQQVSRNETLADIAALLVPDTALWNEIFTIPGFSAI